MNRRFVMFVLAGGFAALVNVAARIGFNFFLSYDVSIVLAYGVGMVTAFLLNRLLVFKAADKAAGGQAVRFALVNVAAVIQVWGVSVLLDRFIFPAVGFTWHAETIAHGIGVASPILASYLLHKNFTFRETPAP